MTNDEIEMTKEWRTSNAETMTLTLCNLFGIWISSFVIPSTFDFRHYRYSYPANRFALKSTPVSGRGPMAAEK
jgi:hypothetical protein